MEKLWQAHPDLRAKHLETVKQLEARGFKRDAARSTSIIREHDKVTLVQRVIALAMPALGAQSFSDGDGEVDFDAWDTGDMNDLTAEVTIVDYSTGDSESGVTDSDVSTAPPTVKSGATPLLIRFLGCVYENAAGGCVAGGIVCIATGAGWPVCTTIACSAAFVGNEVMCGIHELRERYLCRQKAGAYC